MNSIQWGSILCLCKAQDPDLRCKNKNKIKSQCLMVASEVILPSTSPSIFRPLYLTGAISLPPSLFASFGYSTIYLFISIHPRCFIRESKSLVYCCIWVWFQSHRFWDQMLYEPYHSCSSENPQRILSYKLGSAPQHTKKKQKGTDLNNKPDIV